MYAITTRNLPQLTPPHTLILTPVVQCSSHRIRRHGLRSQASRAVALPPRLRPQTVESTLHSYCGTCGNTDWFLRRHHLCEDIRVRAAR